MEDLIAESIRTIRFVMNTAEDNKERLAAADKILQLAGWKYTKDTKITITDNKSFGIAAKF